MLIWRGVLGFIVFAIGFFLLAFVMELMFGLTSALSPSLAAVFGAAIGGFVGVGGGKLAVDGLVKTYPAKPIAMMFIILNIAVVVGDLLIVGPEGYNLTVAVQVTRGITASIGAFYVLWLGRDPFHGGNQRPPVERFP